MEKTIGIKLLKGIIHCAIMTGTINLPKLDYKTISVKSCHSDGERLVWFENKFKELIDKESPSRIAYCITYAPSKNQIPHLTFPLAILIKLAQERNIPIEQFVKQNFTPNKYGFKGKGFKILDNKCTEIFTVLPTSNKAGKEATLAAWALLPEGN
ncbi:MAG: hypothetical protein GY804_12040 [Alphaproteobacteria bacterium]|nr:hypothetical protein [Alphaproteobacteria bacterium]